MSTASSTDAILHLNTVGAPRLDSIEWHGAGCFARVAFASRWAAVSAEEPQLTVVFYGTEQLDALIAVLQEARERVAAVAADVQVATTHA